MAQMNEELHGLLAELRLQPERLMLRTRARRFQDLLRPDIEVLRPTTGMGPIEAKLLEAHREELALVLLRASQVVVETEPDVLVPRDERGRIVSGGIELGARASSLLSSRFSGSESSEMRALLSTVLGPDTSAAPIRLAVASLRLDPRPSTRIWVGVHEDLCGDPSRGIELQRSVLDQGASAFAEAYAWSNIAGMQTKVGRFHDAVESGRAAFQAYPTLARTGLSWFVAAVQAGLENEAYRASHEFASVLQPGGTELTDYMDTLRNLRTRGDWSPTVVASRTITALRGRLPEAAEVLIEVLH